jgi:16S rRNA (cytosine967-C5)-methyltransferase
MRRRIRSRRAHWHSPCWRAFELQSAHADVALAAALVASTLPTRDRALASRLVYGALAWQGRLDWQIARLADRDPATFDPHVRIALRLGLYQLTLLDRVPDHAAVATSVELAKRHVPAAGRLVNAVLRRVTRERDRLPLPDPSGDPFEHLALTLSHPRWLVERWHVRFGAAVADLLRANNEAAPTVLRARAGGRADLLARLANAGIPAEPGRFGPEAIRVHAADPHGNCRMARGRIQRPGGSVPARRAIARPGTRDARPRCLRSAGRQSDLRRRPHE